MSALACVALSACGQQQPAQLTGAALVERGEYLVNNIGGCNDCHTPMTPQGPDMTQSLHGATLMFTPTIEIPWAPTAPPLAGLPAGYTEEQFVAFMQTGLRPDGSRPLPPMPPFRLNEEDARAMAAYIATLPQATP
jgi:mono/diheme cytochrome c family protein